MKMTEYIGKARKALNTWAEKHVPGGTIWSEDLGESYRIYLTAFPVAGYGPVGFTGLFGGVVISSLLHPSYGALAGVVFYGAATAIAWATLHVPRKIYYKIDKIFTSIDLLAISDKDGKKIPIAASVRYDTPLLDEEKTPKFFMRIYKLWLRDHGLDKIYEAEKQRQERLDAIHNN